MLAFLKLIAEILRGINLLKSLAEWMSQQITAYELKKASEKMGEALEKSKVSKDTSALDDIFRNP